MALRFLLFVFSFLFLTTAYAQNARLHQVWASPRLGDEVTVQLLRISDNKKMGEFTFTDLTGDTGCVNVGPVTLKAGDSTYTADPIRICVIDSLPAERRGFWFRFETIEGQRFLITEQRMPHGAPREDENMHDLFAEIETYGIREQGLKVTQNSSHFYEQTMIKAGVEIRVPYRVTMYKIEISDTFDGEYSIEKSMISKWPEDVPFPEIIIRK